MRQARDRLLINGNKIAYWLDKTKSKQWFTSPSPWAHVHWQIHDQRKKRKVTCATTIIILGPLPVVLYLQTLSREMPPPLPVWWHWYRPVTLVCVCVHRLRYLFIVSKLLLMQSLLEWPKANDSDLQTSFITDSLICCQSEVKHEWSECLAGQMLDNM